MREKKHHEKVLQVCSKYGLHQMRSELLFDEELHSYFSIFSVERNHLLKIGQELTEKEEKLLRKSSISEVFIAKYGLFKAGLKEWAYSSSQLWNECYPFYHLLLQPNSMLSMNIVLYYSMARFIIDRENYDDEYNKFELILEDKISSFEIIVASLDERELLKDFNQEFDDNPDLANLLARYLKKR